MQLIWVASLLGALLFFIAGAAAVVLRQRGSRPAALTDPAARLALSEAARLRALDQTRSQELAELRRALTTAEATLRDQQAALDDQTTHVERDVVAIDQAHSRELEMLRERAVRAEAAAADAKQL
ncbi:MAG: hypothetical protein M3680_17165, partial [Myxococcota bacterium]|nr:hypothetical protein [Myxococcota bacterium]